MSRFVMIGIEHMTGRSGPDTPVPPDGRRTIRDSNHVLLAEALRSDRLWFEAGARLTYAKGFMLATMPGFENLAAGNVGFMEHWPGTGPALKARLHDIEGRFRNAGAAAIRFYAPAPAAPVTTHMKACGYAMRAEKIFAFRAGAQEALGLQPVMVPVLDAKDWGQKLQLQRTSGLPADGHPCAPEQWVALERMKSAQSDITFYLFKDESEAVATAALMWISPQIVRLKNLLVRADARQRGVAGRVLQTVLARIAGQGAEYLVLFGIAGSPGERLYQAAGGTVLGSVWEYGKVLNS